MILESEEARLINDRPGPGPACVRATSEVQTAEKLKITERSEILEKIGMKATIEAGSRKRGVEGCKKWIGPVGASRGSALGNYRGEV